MYGILELWILLELAFCFSLALILLLNRVDQIYYLVLVYSMFKALRLTLQNSYLQTGLSRVSSGTIIQGRLWEAPDAAVCRTEGFCLIQEIYKCFERVEASELSMEGGLGLKACKCFKVLKRFHVLWAQSAFQCR